MTPRKVHRFTNPSKLTVAEAAEARRLCALVEQDKDEIIAEGGRILAEKRAPRGCRQRSRDAWA